MEELTKEIHSGNGMEMAEITNNEMTEKDERREGKEIEIEDCLVRALQSFELDQCTWGVSLTHLQMALFYS